MEEKEDGDMKGKINEEGKKYEKDETVQNDDKKVNENEEGWVK